MKKKLKMDTENGNERLKRKMLMKTEMKIKTEVKNEENMNKTT